ncbi:MAG: CdaR family protein [Verrucomicrobiota bacterium]
MHFRDLILHNFWLKLASLVMATMLWFVIFATQTNLRFSESTRIMEKHSITVLKSSEDVRATLVTPSHVDVVVSGPVALLEGLSSSDIEVYVDLTDIKEANELIKRVQVFARNGVKVVEIRPPTVTIRRPQR